MMKKIIFLLIIILSLNTFGLADDSNGLVDIPTLTIEQLMSLSVSKQAKVDIIKKNNTEIETYKSKLSSQISIAAESIDNLRNSEDIQNMSEAKMAELRSLLEFLLDSTKTLNEDVSKVSNEIDAILDLIIAKGMKLEQYDQIIEKQNTLIVKMKNILSQVEKI